MGGVYEWVSVCVGYVRGGGSELLRLGHEALQPEAAVPFLVQDTEYRMKVSTAGGRASSSSVLGLGPGVSRSGPSGAPSTVTLTGIPGGTRPRTTSVLLEPCSLPPEIKSNSELHVMGRKTAWPTMVLG